MQIDIVQGDITKLKVDAIVNAANTSLFGGGGVDGAIHAAAGPELLAECRKLRATTYPDGLASGLAVATGAGNLPARWVIHTPGPNRHVGQTSTRVLSNCFTNSLYVASRRGATSIAFPAIGAGAYGWDPEEVATDRRRSNQELVRYLPARDIDPPRCPGRLQHRCRGSLPQGIRHPAHGQ